MPLKSSLSVDRKIDFRERRNIPFLPQFVTSRKQSKMGRGGSKMVQNLQFPDTWWAQERNLKSRVPNSFQTYITYWSAYKPSKYLISHIFNNILESEKNYKEIRYKLFTVLSFKRVSSMWRLLCVWRVEPNNNQINNKRKIFLPFIACVQFCPEYFPLHWHWYVFPCRCLHVPPFWQGW